MLSRLILRRQYSIILQSKFDDVEYRVDKVVRKALPAMQQHDKYRRLLLRPPLENFEEQARQFRIAIDTAWQQGGWCVDIDELFYMDEKLGLREPIDMLLTQGRSKRITTVIGMQRPAWISRFALSQATHVLSFTAEGRDAKTIAESTTREFGETVTKLQQYQFAWYYRPTRTIWTGRMQDLVKEDT